MLKSIRYFPSKEVRMIANAGGSMRVGMHSLRSDPRCSGRSRNAGCKCQGNQKHFERQFGPGDHPARCESLIELKRLISERVVDNVIIDITLKIPPNKAELN